MNTLVIHPLDKSTEMLELVYKDKNYTVIRDYNISKEFVSNVVFGCEIKGVDKERHMYQIKLVAPSKMLADKTVQFIFLTY